jgi:hypothetical protein
MPGLDPGIHEAAQLGRTVLMGPLLLIMDCRVKPGNDVVRVRAYAWRKPLDVYFLSLNRSISDFS